jgi:hypothetical protein
MLIIKLLTIGVRMKYMAILMMLFSITAEADWSRADTTRQSIFTGVLALDWAQTRYIAKHPDEFHEINTILGEHPTTGRVDKYFASATLIHWGASYVLPDKYRAIWQNVSIGFEAGVVARNINLGIGFKF